MSSFSRRRFLKTASAAAALGAAGSLLEAPARAADFQFQPEKGAKLRVLRWKRFVQGEEDAWMANTVKFTKQTGIEVRVDSENWEDLRPKAAVAANVGAGPDIIIGTNEDPQQYPEQLLDITDLADYLGKKYGGWYETCHQYGMYQGKWIALPTGAAGGAPVYRRSLVTKAGFEKFPTDFPGFLKVCKALKAQGTPGGLALGHATGDGNDWTHWCLWGYGGRLADEQDRVAINSQETVAALEYAAELYQTFVPGTASWLDPSNNKAFLAGDVSLTFNGISIYYAAKNSEDPKVRAVAADIQHAPYPVGPAGKPGHGGTLFPAFIFKYTKVPQAAKEYLRFMMEKEQYEPWQAASIGYIAHPLRAYEANPVWKADPQHAFFRDTVKDMRHYGYAGKLGKSSASAIADFIVVDMFAEVCTGAQSAKSAAQRAERRAKRYYKT
jgi:multiple sugar transport system substrate-binding protein